MPEDPALVAAIRFGILLIAASTFAVLLFRAAIPGGRPAAALVGGLIAGLLAGPAVLGTVRPNDYARLFVGAEVEQQSLEDAEAMHEAEIKALEASGVSPQAIIERRFEQRAELAPVVDTLSRARVRSQSPARFAAAGFVTLACLSASVGAPPRKLTRAGFPAALLAGVSGVLVAGLTLTLIILWLLPVERREALAIGFGVSGGSIMAGLYLRWVGRDGRGPEPLIAGLAGAGIAAGAAAAFWPACAPWLAPPVAAAIIGMCAARTLVRSRRARSFARAIVLAVVPTLTADLVARVHISDLSSTLYFLCACLLLAGSGSYLGTWLGYLSFGAPAQRSRAAMLSLEGHASGVPLTQVLILSMLAASGLIDPASVVGGAIVVGVILGAIQNELTVTPMRALVRPPVSL